MLIVSDHWTAIYFSWRQAAVAGDVCINLLEEVKGLPFLLATFSEKNFFSSIYISMGASVFLCIGGLVGLLNFAAWMSVWVS